MQSYLNPYYICSFVPGNVTVNRITNSSKTGLFDFRVPIQFSLFMENDRITKIFREA